MPGDVRPKLTTLRVPRAGRDLAGPALELGSTAAHHPVEVDQSLLPGRPAGRGLRCERLEHLASDADSLDLLRGPTQLRQATSPDVGVARRDFRRSAPGAGVRCD